MKVLKMRKKHMVRFVSCYPTIMIIQYFLKELGSMNYYTLLPNYYHGFNSTPNLSYPKPQQNIPQVLTILSSALKLSISQYAASYTPTKPVVEDLMPKIDEKKQLKKEKTILKLDSEEKVEKEYNFQKKEKANIQQNIVILQGSGQKHIQNSALSNTNEQILSQNLPSQQNKAKDDFSNSHKKEKIRSKKHSFQVFVPQICLIQAASLSSLQIGEEELKLRKQSLMHRQVQCWNEKMKNRRDKREIRMLNN